MDVMGDAAKTDKTGWFKRTGWLEHFKGRNLAHLGHQVRPPDRNEAKLKRVAKLRFICYYLRTIRDKESRLEESPLQEDREEDSVGSSDTEDTESEYSTDNSKDDNNSEEGAQRHCEARKRQLADKMKNAHELFCWQDNQKPLAMQLWLALDGSDRADQTLALLVSLSLFVLVSYGKDVFLGGLLHYLAVLGIDTETGACVRLIHASRNSVMYKSTFCRGTTSRSAARRTDQRGPRPLS
jgi:hypothetical protein